MQKNTVKKLLTIFLILAMAISVQALVLATSGFSQIPEEISTEANDIAGTTDNGTHKDKFVVEHNDKNDNDKTVGTLSGGTESKTSGSILIWLYAGTLATAYICMLPLAIKEYIRRRRQNKEDADMFV